MTSADTSPTIVRTSECQSCALPGASYSSAVEGLLAASKDVDRLSSLEGEGVIARFEAAFAKTVGSRFALSVSSGTAALHTALSACDIGPGDEVIVSPYGWGQTVVAVLLVGATPVFADIDPVTSNLDPDNVDRRISSNTRAVLVTHVFGCPADMAKLSELCESRGIRLIADAAQGLGARLDGKEIGAWGDISCFSFGRGKAITMGEGGAVVCDDPDLYERMILVSQHPLRGIIDIEDYDFRQSVTELCMSYRMSPLLAAIGLGQIDLLPQVMARKQKTARKLAATLQGIAGFNPPTEPLGLEHGYRSFVLRYDSTELGGYSRVDIICELQAQGIPAHVGPVRTPIHLRAPFNDESISNWFPNSLRCTHRHSSWNRGMCPVAERRCAEEEIVIASTTRWQQVPDERIEEIGQAIEYVVNQVPALCSQQGAKRGLQE